MLHGPECANRILLSPSTYGDLRDQEWVTKNKTENQVHQQECGTTTFPHFKREPPNIPQSNSTPCSSCNKAEFVGKFITIANHQVVYIGYETGYF